MADKAQMTARDVAHQVMDGIFLQQRSMDETLGRLEARHEMDQLAARDNAFLRAVLSHTLRRVGEADKIIGGFLKEQLQGPRLSVQNILRLGTAELLFMGRESYAVVDAYVSIAKRGNRDAQHLSGLVNAVLRRISKEIAPIETPRDPLLNTPHWLMDALVRAWGGEKAARIARAQGAEAPLDLTLKGGSEAAEDIIQTFLSDDSLGARLLQTGALRIANPGPVPLLPGFEEGRWWVQDAAAQLPVALLGDVAGQAVLDLCSAPGGKTLQLADRGAKVTSVDRSARRLGIVRQNLDRVGLDAELVESDAGSFQPQDGLEPFRFILLDAPCSATGTIRRNPDVPWLRQAEDIKALTLLQDRLLDHAANLLPQGGILVYCTCSLLPQEGEGRIQRLFARHPDLERVPVQATEVGGIADFITTDGDFRTFPLHLRSEGGLDGFYAARVQKKGRS